MKKSRVVFVLAMVGMLIGLGTVGAREPIGDREAVKAVKASKAPYAGTVPTRDTGVRAAPGTIAYDSGVFSALPTNPQAPTPGAFYSFGNRFDTYGGNPIPLPITVTQVTFFPGLLSGSSTGASFLGFLSLYGPLNTAQTAAPAVGFSGFGSLQANSWNTVSFFQPPFTGTGAGSFQLGLFAGGSASTTSTTPCAVDCIALDTTGTSNFHAMSIRSISAGGASFAMIPGANALLRVSGNVIPVELMRFGAE